MSQPPPQGALTKIKAWLALHPRWPWTLLYALVAFSPAFVLGWHIWHNAVNTPVWDDWERGPLIQKWMEGRLTFTDLYAPHIDHRILFPRLIFLGLNAVTEGDLRWEIGVAFFCGVAAALGVATLAKQTVLKDGRIWGVVLAANMIIFSPIQWDNWLWGVQVAFMMPMACFIWALVMCLKPWAWWKRLLAAGALAIVGTHSFGHGFIVWPAVLGLALLQPKFTPAVRERVYFVGTWVVLMAVVLGCYTMADFNNSSDPTHSYGMETGTPPPSVVHHQGAMAEPLRALNFLSTLAGNPFARMHLLDPLDTAPLIGFVLMALFMALCAQRMWGFFSRPELLAKALPWMALGGAVMVGLAAVTAGRMHTSVSRAASIRYVSISQYLAIAVLMLAVLWWRQTSLKGLHVHKKELGGILVGVFAGFMIPAWSFGFQMMTLIKEGRLQGQAALLFINHFEPLAYHRIDATVDFARKWANVLDGYGLMDPPLVKTLELEQFSPNHKDRPIKEAAVEGFVANETGGYRINGFAQLEGRTADAVLLTWETVSQPAMIFALVEPTREMIPHPYPNDLELVGRVRPHPKAYCRWKETFLLNDVFKNVSADVQEVVVRTWVFDVTLEKARRIQGAWSINRNGEFTMVESSGMEGVMRFTEDGYN